MFSVIYQFSICVLLQTVFPPGIVPNEVPIISRGQLFFQVDGMMQMSGSGGADVLRNVTESARADISY